MIIVKMIVLLIKEKNLQEVAVSILLQREFELHHLPLHHYNTIVAYLQRLLVVFTTIIKKFTNIIQQQH